MIHTYIACTLCMRRVNLCINGGFQLVDAKSHDKKMTLLHFIVDTVKTRFPTVANFETELRFMEKASTGTITS